MRVPQAGIDPAAGGGASRALGPGSAAVIGGGIRRSPSPGRELRRILGLSVPVTVILAERDMTVRSILALTVGSIIEFDVPFDADLTLHVANRPIGRGQAVKAGENFGLRITRIQDVHERIQAMGGS